MNDAFGRPVSRAQRRIERMHKHVARTTPDKRVWTLNRYWGEEEYRRYQEDLELWAARMRFKHVGRMSEIVLYQGDIQDDGTFTITAEVKFLEPGR